MNRRRYYHPFLCSLLFLQSLSALCQITISTLEQDLQGIEETSDVVLTRLGNFVDESVQQGMVLDFGDQLRSQSGNTVVELNCPGGSLLTLSEKFRIVITPPAADQDCGITLLSGGADFLTDQSTSLESGEVTLGSKRTQYGMRVTRTDLGLQREVFVYDGEVEVSGSTSDQRRSLGGGKKLIVQASVWDERRLDQADLGRAATLHARVDTSKAKIATAEFYATNVLPRASALELAATSGAESLLAVADDGL